MDMASNNNTNRKARTMKRDMMTIEEKKRYRWLLNDTLGELRNALRSEASLTAYCTTRDTALAGELKRNIDQLVTELDGVDKELQEEERLEAARLEHHRSCI